MNSTNGLSPSLSCSWSLASLCSQSLAPRNIVKRLKKRQRGARTLIHHCPLWEGPLKTPVCAVPAALSWFFCLSVCLSYIQAHTCTHMHTHRNAQTHTYTCTQTHPDTHRDTQRHRQTHRHTHAESLWLLPVQFHSFRLEHCLPPRLPNL